MTPPARLAGTLLLVVGIACSADKYAVTFDSYPRGATLICGGTNRGYTPQTLLYDEEVREQEELQLGACSAHWASGARAVYGVVPIKQFPQGVQQTVQRPDVPGLELDAEFALRVMQLQMQREQIELQQLQQLRPPPQVTPGFNRFVLCKQIGDFSGRVYQFEYACPAGYMQAF